MTESTMALSFVSLTDMRSSFMESVERYFEVYVVHVGLNISGANRTHLALTFI
jgi:hypothetical protein